MPPRSRASAAASTSSATPASTQKEKQSAKSKGKQRANEVSDGDAEEHRDKTVDEFDLVPDSDPEDMSHQHDQLDGEDDDNVELPPPLRHATQQTQAHANRNGIYASQGSGEPPMPTPTLGPNDESEEDCIKILVATDNHIGYGERDPVRGKDSIDTFEEILQLAREHEVDMLLLVGDLFHENKPTRGSLHNTIALLREYCMGPRPIALEIVSDVGIGIQSGFSFPPINYEDPNYNIGLPVFSIHGNHDDPQGAGPEGALCALDILSASGLVNYFGRQDLPGEATTEEEALQSGIQVKPILLSKGTTKLAMYGIGNIRDERFHAEMRKNRISMFRPAENADDWFNLLLIHQNRVPHGPKSSVPENGFGDEVDLILWGHEHDCRIDPEPVTGKGYYISQPGSSVATSLSRGESEPKHVGLLKIQGKQFQMEKLRLRSVRPFVIDDVNLEEVTEIEEIALEDKIQVNKYLKKRVHELIAKANEEWDELYADEDNKPARKLPLIRLRVEYTTHEIGNPQRFGQDFAKLVANPRDIVQFVKKKTISRNKKVTIDQPEGVNVGDFDDELPERIEKVKVETLVRQYLEAQTLQILHENGIAHAINAFVDKDDRHAIDSFITKTLESQRKQIERSERPEDQDTDEEIEHGVAAAKAALANEFDERAHAKKNKGKQREPSIDEQASDQSDFDKMDLDDASVASEPVAKGKGRAGATASKGTTSRAKKDLFKEASDDSASDDSAPAKKKAPAKKTAPAARKAPATRKSSAPSQSQLNFAPARSTSRAASKAAPARGRRVAASPSDEDEEDAVIDLDDSDSDPPPRKPSTRKR